MADLLFSVFPNNSFRGCLETFRKAIDQPSDLSESLLELGLQLGLGATSHIMITAREFLSLSNFHMFTRDYIKRCCDLVEHTVKLLLAPKLQINVGHKSLGGIIKILRNPRYNNMIPRDLIYNLDSFNATIYCPAKHEVPEKEEEHMYSVADAVVVTFIALKLCQKIQNFVRSSGERSRVQISSDPPNF